MTEKPATPAPLARTVVGSGPGLLLAHGAAGSGVNNWGPLLEDLAAHRTVVAPDFPGSGDSPFEPVAPTLDELADRLVAAAVEEGLETFDLAAYSLGAAVAVRAVNRHPQRVRSLLLVAGVAGGDHRLRITAELAVGLADQPELMARFLLSVVFGSSWVSSLTPEQLAGLHANLLTPLPAASRQQFELVGSLNVRDELGSIAVPTLVISPTEDMLVQPSQHRALADGIPGARFTELAAGHMAVVEQLPELRKLILDFLTGPAE
ncbi:alpha/beta fold hydrolase [Streptomyces sp. CB01881]|uniref:alpha/beta fold hydrolase n=1 Tax=Streptomyces sp. CB01881 TaxID=2078691 RepID=UPI000CDC7872|nr:alpha/beta fold hydrolase [Streptomyces sp. CB01881]AUY48862.1 alpha/beta hydrolase [Streptomyces sp. CB01881]TYC77350.1 alpha/beta fold hydrolase [Streptomyces sp. CB01881]